MNPSIIQNPARNHYGHLPTMSAMDDISDTESHEYAYAYHNPTRTSNQELCNTATTVIAYPRANGYLQPFHHPHGNPYQTAVNHSSGYDGHPPRTLTSHLLPNLKNYQTGNGAHFFANGNGHHPDGADLHRRDHVFDAADGDDEDDSGSEVDRLETEVDGESSYYAEAAHNLNSNVYKSYQQQQQQARE